MNEAYWLLLCVVCLCVVSVFFLIQVVRGDVFFIFSNYVFGVFFGVLLGAEIVIWYFKKSVSRSAVEK